MQLLPIQHGYVCCTYTSKPLTNHDYMDGLLEPDRKELNNLYTLAKHRLTISCTDTVNTPGHTSKQPCECRAGKRRVTRSCLESLMLGAACGSIHDCCTSSNYQ